MKQNQTPCIKTKMVIHRGKRSKTLSEVKPVKNLSKNLQSFLEISPCKRKSFIHINCESILIKESHSHTNSQLNISR